MSEAPLVELFDVDMVFAGGVQALAGVSLRLARGEIVGLVGESGSGKTTLCRVAMGLENASRGLVRFDGRPLQDILAREPLALRRRAQMLQQDAVASLSPRLRVRSLVEEPLAIHALDKVEGRRRIAELFSRLGLSAEVADKFPHQVSGGQARRIAIARALALRPELVVADEPTAGLDVSVQGDLLNLLLDLHAEFALTYLIVSHNLAVVRRITARTIVMYLGQIVESAPTLALFERPAHPYAAALVSTHPTLDPRKRRARIVLKGEIPSVVNPPSGCRFHTRCPHAEARCRAEMPALRTLSDAREVRCHFPLAV